ncbi:hypothetical protein AB0F81_20150 [Actinoplanes sp. NPDC024001]|uniref:hypothetical protein n=1 Tax=Actinoplanes sp. NPDC024001 TaxID=3154598 RepID=UPI0033C46612
MRLDGFRDTLQEIDRTAPVTQLTWVGSEVGGWAAHLRSIGIEPDLFSIQRRMNADEGDAATAFKFKSSREFVEWLLKVVLDPQDAVSVAENFDSYARTVGDRQAMLLERDFADGAVGSLRPVGAAHDRHRASRLARETAESEGLALLRRVRAREAAEADATARLRELANEASAAATSRETDRDRARDVVNEIGRQTLVLEHAAAIEEQRQATADRDGADADLRAWDLAGLLERKTAANVLAARFAEEIVQAEETALPALQARDRAAGDLLRKLSAEVAAARTEQSKLTTLSAELLDRAREIDGERTQTMRDAERWRSEQSAINTQVTESRQHVEAAVAEGLLTAGQPVGQAAADAQEAAVAAAVKLKDLEHAARDAQAAVRETGKQAQAAHNELVATRGRHADAARNLQTIVDRTVPLTSDEVVRAALSTDTVDVDQLDEHIDNLIGQLHDDAALREQHLDELRAAHRDDQRLLNALGDGGFLPPRTEVEASIQALQAAGISAHPGWRYLADSVAAGERDEIITAHPHLADGVIIVDPDALPAARDILTAARLLPAAAVAVGTGERMLTVTGGTDARGLFVIEPNPALFDPEAAEQRREQLREAMSARGTEIQNGAAALAHLRTVSTDLVAWRRDCPPGRLAELREDLACRETELATATEADKTSREAAETAETAVTRIDGELTELRTLERGAADRSATLARLAQAVAAVDKQKQRLPELAAWINLADQTERELTEKRDQAQHQASEAARAADRAADRAERHRTEMRGIVTSTGEHATQIPETPVGELRSAYQAAAATYAAVEVGQDMRAAADAAENEAARLRAEVSRQDTTDIDRAQQLLATPDGADETGRQAAIARTNGNGNGSTAPSPQRTPRSANSAAS